ncbi:MAG: hypothetical protein LBS44_01910 [Deltaproteobacteria bacterium]|jgi:hypothetical protein|nr:hypothetical protein [Deltaproteobacteria bacterium]
MGLTIAEQYIAEGKTSIILALIRRKFEAINQKVEAAIRLVTDDDILLNILDIAATSKTLKQFSNKFSSLIDTNKAAE